VRGLFLSLFLGYNSHMSTANKIFSNTLWQTVIRAGGILIGVLNLGLVTRILGTTHFGFYTTIFAFVQIFVIFADLGLYLTLLREISEAKDKNAESKAVNNIFTIRFFASIFFLGLAPLVVFFLPYDAEVKNNIVYFLLAFFFQSLFSTLSAVFAKKLEMPRVAIADLANKLIYFFIALYLFFHGGSLASVLAWNSFSQGVAFVLLLFFLRKHVKLSFAWDFAYWKKILLSTWPLAVTVVLNLIYFKADTLILSAYARPEDVGLYGAPYRVLEVLTTFPHMFMSLILPLFTAAYVAKNYEALKNIWQNTFDFFVIISGAMLLGVWLVSKPLMIILAGADFAASGPILNILILATAAIYFGTMFSYLVVAIGEQKAMVKYFLLVAIFGLAGYFIFIPKFGYWAAAWMTVAVEIMLWFFAWLVIKQKLNLKSNLTVVYKVGESMLVAFLAVYFVKDLPFIFLPMIALLVYGLCLYFFKAVDKDLFKQLLNKK
jgi:O-antigen/teichoic acid export membrane protein